MDWCEAWSFDVYRNGVLRVTHIIAENVDFLVLGGCSFSHLLGDCKPGRVGLKLLGSPLFVVFVGLEMGFVLLRFSKRNQVLERICLRHQRGEQQSSTVLSFPRKIPMRQE